MKKTNLNLVVCKSEKEAKDIQDLIKAFNNGYIRGCKDMRKWFIKGSFAALPIIVVAETVDWKKVKEKIKSIKFKVSPN